MKWRLTGSLFKNSSPYRTITHFTRQHPIRFVTTSLSVVSHNTWLVLTLQSGTWHAKDPAIPSHDSENALIKTGEHVY
jgi:hypothetical protein